MNDFPFKGMDPKPSRGGGIGKPKPRKRSHATAAVIELIRAAKCQHCRLCGETTGIQAHHLIARGIGGAPLGLWVEPNIVGLCLECHRLVEARDSATMSLLRGSLTDDEYAYLVGRMGEGWLERRFPVKGVD